MAPLFIRCCAHSFSSRPLGFGRALEAAIGKPSAMPQLAFRLRYSPLQEALFPRNLPFRIPSSPRSSSPPTPSPCRRLVRTSSAPSLRRLTSRIVKLTRRRQLHQIFEEVEVARKRYRKLNTIVMNAVLEACVHCGDVDSAQRIFEEMAKPESCGVDSVSYGILLKGLGEARRVDEAFQILECLEQGSAKGSPKLSPKLIFGLLNALLEAGDMRRANGLVARFRRVLHEDGHSVLLYNLLMKGYTKTDFPLGALTIRDEMLRQGLKPDKLTYNTLIFACIRHGRADIAIQLLAEMKEEAEKASCYGLLPDTVTYTTLLKGLGSNKDLVSVLKIVVEMKSLPDLVIDRIAYTAMVDALLACGSTKDALCIFGEMIKQNGKKNNLRPKPHLYLSMMRVFAMRGDFDMVKRLHIRMWSDSVGSISPSVQIEADELLMEAAINDDQLDVARRILHRIVTKREGFSWTTRGGMVAIRVEALSGFANSTLSPYVLPQVSLNDPIEKYMIAFEETDPLPASLNLDKVIMRFLKDSAIPAIDDWGSCVGIVHRDDCKKLDAPLWTMMRGPPPCVTTSTSIGRVIELLLDKKYKMVVVVRNSNVYETSYSSSSRPVGVFTLEKLFNMAMVASGTFSM
ncbi:pentatricopeptide repeat-containing protein At5g10690 isoform X1 [Elaeis guineensis]|uniref:Pentatricopeptide repeat-containing protein At5g10690 isoform X1 n=1 Tax=Elaeis guineensis var. tenera TaxID=51953 RepID=A0A8N4ETL0_ELAGV|nr:pentatricopeptide repeat-containing protein At5g10690 isoform X1 [Elaeis guineensis]